MRTTPAPDLESMVSGGEARRRRRTTTQIGMAAAAALLVGGGLYGVNQIDGGDADTAPATAPSAPVKAADPPRWPAEFQSVEAGTYRTEVGVAANGARIQADLTIGGSNWEGSNYPVAYDGEHFAGIGVYRAESVAGGCKMEDGLKPAATEPQQLAQQLTGMPRSVVVQQPTATNAFGHSATHLRMRVDAACGSSAYQVADAAAGGRGISYFDEKPEDVSVPVIIDFWVVDVNGTTVVVDMFRTDDAPKTLVDQVVAARESIAFVKAE